MSETWEDWQLELLDDYILGYTSFQSQEDLAYEIGKSLNAIKIKLSRRRMQVEDEIEKRNLTIEEYKTILANRFDKTSLEISSIINTSKTFLIHELNEIDSLECMEFMEENFADRELTSDEYEIFLRLYIKKKKNKFQIAHILNRPINFVEEMICSYEQPLSRI